MKYSSSPFHIHLQQIKTTIPRTPESKIQNLKQNKLNATKQLMSYSSHSKTHPSHNTIDYIEIPSRDITLSESFFSKLLGWKFTEYGNDYKAFHDSRTSGGVYTSDKISTTDNGGSLIVIYSENLESTMTEAIKLGATITKEIFSFPGGRRFQFTEPGGSELAIWSHNLK